MLNLEQHPYFKEYIDEKSGVKSYILKEKAAQAQQQFYFTNTSLTFDGKYLWITCLNPPSHANTVAVVSMDENNPSIKLIGGTAKYSGIPAIIPGTHDLAVPVENAMYRVTVDGEFTKLFELSEDFLHYRTVTQLLTHTSFSCDGKLIIMDAEIGDKVYILTGNIETGEVKLIHNFDREHNHAQFSPNNPNLILLDQDWRRDANTGEYFGIDNRMWLMDIRKTRFEPLLQSSWYGNDGTEYAHDFWSKDGMICWVDYNTGAYECDIETRKVTHVWHRPMCHCYTTADRKLWCADETPYAWSERPCRTLFYDRETDKEIDIFSALPEPRVKRGGSYHLDPHPAFTDDGKYIISTVTVLDGIADVAITPVEPLLKLCREKGTKVK